MISPTWMFVTGLHFMILFLGRWPRFCFLARALLANLFPCVIQAELRVLLRVSLAPLWCWLCAWIIIRSIVPVPGIRTGN